MNALASNALEEVCVLIAAQLDMLEVAEPFTPNQLCEFQFRAERIKVLCEELEQMNASELMAESLESVA